MLGNWHGSMPLHAHMQSTCWVIEEESRSPHCLKRVVGIEQTPLWSAFISARSVSRKLACSGVLLSYRFSNIVPPITSPSTPIVPVAVLWSFSPEENSHFGALLVVWLGHNSLTF